MYQNRQKETVTAEAAREVDALEPADVEAQAAEAVKVTGVAGTAKGVRATKSARVVQAAQAAREAIDGDRGSKGSNIITADKSGRVDRVDAGDEYARTVDGGRGGHRRQGWQMLHKRRQRRHERQGQPSKEAEEVRAAT